MKSEWTLVRLADVCDRITVGHVGPMVDEYVDDGIPFLRSQNIRPFSLDLADVKFIGRSFHDRLSKSALQPGDVAIVRTGYPGTAAVVPVALGVANCADLVIATPGPQLNADFLAALMNSAWGVSAVGGRLVGSAQQHFNVSAAKSMVVHLPPRKVQDRVATIVTAYSRLIANNERRIQILEEVAHAIYREWFVEFRNPGQEDVQSPDVDSDSMPEGWREVPLDEVAVVNQRTLKNGSDIGEIRYVDISSVETGHVAPPVALDFPDAPGRARRLVQHGDVIWSTVRPNRRSHALLIEPPENLVVSTGFAVLTATAVPFSYLYRAVTSDDFVAYLTNRATGSAYPAVTGKTFAGAPVVLPEPDVAAQYGSIVEPMDLLIAGLHQANEHLRRTRDLLLPRLISGEIDVSELDIDVGESAA